MFHAVICLYPVPNVECSPSTPYEAIIGAKVNLSKTFQMVSGDLVVVHMPKDKRSWKFDLSWDIGVYVGQPKFSVEAALIYVLSISTSAAGSYRRRQTGDNHGCL